jgi:hypothetical protein
MLVLQDFSCSGGVCCRNVVSGLTAAATLAPVASSAVEVASAVCRWRRHLLRLRRWLWKGLQRSVGNGNAGGCGGIGGGSGISGRSATAMVSAAVALAEAFTSVVEAAAVGTVAV